MTEAEAREIVERYEALTQQALAAAGYTEGSDFLIEFPVEISGGHLVVRENVDGDRWALRRVDMRLS